MSKQDNPNVVGNIAIVFMSILLIAVGCIMLFTDAVRMIYFCYGAGACLLVWGIWMISRYFLHKEFQRTTNYGFSVGTLVVILGAIDLIRAQDIADSIPNYLGILVLIEGVVMLQNTVQLKNLHGDLWIVSLIFSLLKELTWRSLDRQSDLFPAFRSRIGCHITGYREYDNKV